MARGMTRGGRRCRSANDRYPVVAVPHPVEGGLELNRDAVAACPHAAVALGRGAHAPHEHGPGPARLGARRRDRRQAEERIEPREAARVRDEAERAGDAERERGRCSVLGAVRPDRLHDPAVDRDSAVAGRRLERHLPGLDPARRRHHAHAHRRGAGPGDAHLTRAAAVAAGAAVRRVDAEVGAAARGGGRRADAGVADLARGAARAAGAAVVAVGLQVRPAAGGGRVRAHARAAGLTGGAARAAAAAVHGVGAQVGAPGGARADDRAGAALGASVGGRGRGAVAGAVVGPCANPVTAHHARGGVGGGGVGLRVDRGVGGGGRDVVHVPAAGDEGEDGEGRGEADLHGGTPSETGGGDTRGE